MLTGLPHAATTRLHHAACCCTRTLSIVAQKRVAHLKPLVAPLSVETSKLADSHQGHRAPWITGSCSLTLSVVSFLTMWATLMIPSLFRSPSCDGGLQRPFWMLERISFSHQVSRARELWVSP